MNYPIKLTVLILSLGAATCAQAELYTYSTAYAPSIKTMLIGSEPFGNVPFLSMTSAFSGDGFSGELRSGFANGKVFYQLVNNANSTVALGSISYGDTEGISSAGINVGINIPYVRQTNEAFNIFTVGQDKASLTVTQERACGGGCFATTYLQAIDFKGGGTVWATPGQSLRLTVAKRLGNGSDPRTELHALQGLASPS
jgi:hypothetical protein